jgi:hypothetical protein
MTRRAHITLLAAAAAAQTTVLAKDNDIMREILETSQKEKKGVSLYVKGQSIPGVVVKIASDSVEMRSREFSRIVVRIDSIDAIAMS